MDKSLIPKGIYCYDENGICPYWKYLGLNESYLNNGEKCEFRDACEEECGTNDNNSCVSRIVRCEYLDYTDETENSLLWDQCKECGINDENL